MEYSYSFKSILGISSSTHSTCDFFDNNKSQFGSLTSYQDSIKSDCFLEASYACQEMMDLFTVSSQIDPVVMIHRGWKDMEGSQNVSKRNDYSCQPQTGNGSTRTKTYDRETESTTKGIHQKFEFINATQKSRNTAPEIKKLVRAHVVRDSSRRKKAMHLKSLQALPPQHKNTSSGSKPESLNSSSTTSSIETRHPRIPNLIFHTLDPHPALSRTIYYISTVGSLMWPLESSLHFNPVSPVGWFDWALSDEALFHALLYTMATYVGLVRGTTESKEAVLHAGLSMKLIGERLGKSVSNGGREEGIIGAVSCLAFTEASYLFVKLKTSGC
jgi:hypothetical protein